jgi:hypothetical protein
MIILNHDTKFLSYFMVKKSVAAVYWLPLAPLTQQTRNMANNLVSSGQPLL